MMPVSYGNLYAGKTLRKMITPGLIFAIIAYCAHVSAKTISSEREFYEMTTNNTPASYVLAADIRLTGKYGNKSYSFGLGGDTLDGNGHILTISQGATGGGLVNAQLKNVTLRLDDKRSVVDRILSSVLEDCKVEGGGFSEDVKDSRFVRCSASCIGVTEAVPYHCGQYSTTSYGLFGSTVTDSVFEGCSVKLELTDNSHVQFGGFANSAFRSQFVRCSADCRMSVLRKAGGIAYYLEGCLVTGCAAKSDISSSGFQGGWLGCIAGEMYCTTVKVSSVSGTLSGNHYSIGGLAGYATGSLFRDCTSDASASGGRYIGCLVGSVDSSTVSRCEAKGAVTGQVYVGGAFGRAKGVSCDCTISSGNVVGDKSFESGAYSMYIGGFVGEAEGSSFWQCRATGSVSGQESELLGGFAGHVKTSSFNAVCAKGNVSGTHLVGGFVGKIQSKDTGTVIENCYARGATTATQDGGWVAAFICGLAGSESDGYGSKVNCCYATGNVTAKSNMPTMPAYGTTYAGGLSPVAITSGMSVLIDTGTATASYWDTTTTGMKLSGLMGEGKASSALKASSTAAMQKMAIYKTWDFNTIWERGADGYPDFQECSACQDQGGGAPKPEPEECLLEIDPAELSFGSGGGWSDVTVTATGNWSVRIVGEEARALSLSPVSGKKGKTVVRASVSANSGATRKWRVEFSTACGDSKMLSVTQDAYVESCELAVSKSSFGFGYLGGSGSAVISSSTRWTARLVSGSDGISFTKRGDKGAGAFAVSVDENLEGLSRGWTIAIESECSETIVQVSQDGRPCRISISGEKHHVIRHKFSALGWLEDCLVETTYQPKNANATWSVFSSPEWVRIIKGSGRNGECIRFCPKRNYSYFERMGEIVVTNLCGDAATVEFVQKGRRPPPDPDPITMSPHLILLHDGVECYSWTTNNAAFTFSLEVRSSSPWMVDSKSGWIAVADQNHEDNTFLLSVARNSEGTRTGTVEVSNTEGLKEIFTVVQTEKTLVISPDWLFFECAPGTSNVSVRCSEGWRAEVEPTAGGWLSVDPMAATGDATVKVSVTTNKTAYVRTGEITFRCGPLERVCRVMQDATAPRLEIFGETELYEGDVVTNRCYLIKADGAMEQVSPSWSFDGSRNVRIDKAGVLCVTNILFTQEVATVKAVLNRGGKAFTATNAVELVPPFGPGVWTADAERVRIAAATNGTLIAVKTSNSETCTHCRQFDAVCESPEFLMWARTNGVWLIAADASKFDDTAAAQAYFNLLRSVATNASEILEFPTLVFAFPDAPFVAVGYDVARVGRKIGGVEYDGTVDALEDGFARYIEMGWFTVTFNPSGGTVEEESRKVKHGVAIGDLPVPTLAGYVFGGWWTAASGGTQVTEDAVLSSNTMVYAHWIARQDVATYFVRLHRNNSANDGATTRSEFIVGIGKVLPTASSLGWVPRDRYNFLGWATTANATSAKYKDGQNVALSSTPDIEVHLYAVWKAQTYVVTLHRNNSANDGATAGRTYTVGASKALPKMADELKWAPRTGYAFLGWATTANATSAKYSDGQGVSLSSTPGAAVHLYAVWKAQTYVVTLHRNNSANDGATADRTFAVGASKALPKMADELKWAPRTGYTFLGWATTANATSAKYSDGQRVSLSSAPGAAVHLYAVWKAQTYVVRLHRNNSAKDTATAGRTFTAGIGKALPKMADELKWTPRTGYAFLGWATTASATAAKYADGATVNLSSTVGAEVHLYAVWKAQTYVVRLHRNNSAKDTATAGRTFTAGIGKALPKAAELKWTPRTGYAFLGWATSASATAAKYADGATVNLSSTVGAEVHLYAVWKAQTYVVRLHRNNSAKDTATAGRTFTAGIGKALPKAAELKWAPRAGYAFLGWATSANATAAKYSDGQRVSLSSTPGAAVHLYAVWKAQTYVVTLHRNNSANDGATAGRTYTIGVGRALPKVSALNWLREKYSFEGWATSANATVAKYTDGQTVSDLTKTPGATVHLYVVWKPKTYIVRLHRNNSARDSSSTGRTFTIGKSRTLPTLSELKWTRTGYTFIGWATSRNSMDVKYWDGQTVSGLSTTPDATVNLYAVWVAGDNKYIVRLHRNLSSSDGSTAGRTFTVGAGRVLPTLAVLNWSRPGYEFLGWATSAGATKAQYANGQSVSGLSNKSGVIVHLYAVWKVGTYVVRLYRNNSPDDGATTGRTFTIYQGRALPTIQELGWSRKGYTFAAWLFPAEDGEVSAFYDGETVSDLTIQPNKVVELFAVWR